VTRHSRIDLSLNALNWWMCAFTVEIHITRGGFKGTQTLWRYFSFRMVAGSGKQEWITREYCFFWIWWLINSV
jgi:hypothetical protein